MASVTRPLTPKEPSSVVVTYSTVAGRRSLGQRCATERPPMSSVTFRRPDSCSASTRIGAMPVPPATSSRFRVDRWITNDDPRAPFGRVGIHPEETDLRAKTAARLLAESRGPRHARISVVRVQLKPHALALKGREILVRVEEPQREHLRIKGDAPNDVTDDE